MITNEHQPILVSTTTAKRLLDIGNSKFWDLVKAGRIELTDSIGRRMVVYRSLERLAPHQGSDRAARHETASPEQSEPAVDHALSGALRALSVYRSDVRESTLWAGSIGAANVNLPLCPSPRSLFLRTLLAIEDTPEELHHLVRALEDEARKAAEEPDQTGFADYLFQRVATLREALR